MKNYYDLLSIEASAPPETIKRAFRREIARYHPDKVQHLGKEFQEMAATRAAQLTEAYRTLSNPDLRAEYDRLLETFQVPPGAPAPHAPEAATASAPEPSPPLGAEPQPSGPHSTLFSEERSTKDRFVRTATLDRIRQILHTELPKATELPVHGFDLVCATQKPRLFGKSRPVPDLLVRLVQEVDLAAIQETWAMASKALASQNGPACVLLFGTVNCHREAGNAVAALKHRPGRAASSLLLIPIDIRDWSARVPHDAPRTCRSILEKLRKTN